MTSSSIQDVSGIYYARRTKGTQNGTSDTDDISGMFQNAMNMAKDQSVSGMADNRTDAGKTVVERFGKRERFLPEMIGKVCFGNGKRILFFQRIRNKIISAR